MGKERRKGFVRFMQKQKTTVRKPGFGSRAKLDFLKNWQLYIMIFPIIVYFFLFSYLPMSGVVGAFQDLSPVLGITGSPWVGFKHFQDFFGSYYFWRLLSNTLLLSLSILAFSFPCPIILAILLNEVRGKGFRRAVQTISYLPFFISMVVICGLIKNFVGMDGIVTRVLMLFGMPQQNLLANPAMFRPIYVISDIWQNIGFQSIIYIAALSGVNQELYESASIDGAGRFKQTIHVTLPGIAPTIIIMLILAIGGLLSVGHEKVILLSNTMNREAADVIQSFVYRKGLIEANYGYSTAVGLFNSVANTALLLLANGISRKVSETSLF